MYLLCVILAGIFWGAMSIFVRGLNAAGFSSMQIMMVRSIIAVALLSIIMFFKDRSLFRIKLKDLWIFICNGVVSLAFFSVCYFTAILECGASVAVVLLYTSPIFVLVLSAVLFRERITFFKTIALVLTVIGCVLVAGIIGDGQARITGKGLLVGILSGLGYGLYSIFGTVALKKYRPLTVTFYSFVFAAIVMIPISGPVEAVELLQGNTVLLSFGVAIFCTLVPFLLYTFGLSGLEAGKAAIFATIEPLVGTLVGIFLWGESSNFLKLAGIALIFVAIGLCGVKEKDK
ncbi:MAG: EamA family transporter [Treponema sp.]|nr:EamA family transporter [Candidatus Treponema equifaecale]